MSEWRDVTVDALCSRVTSGGTPSRKRADYFADDGIPWVKSQELIGARIVATEEHISEAGLMNSSAKLLPRDTVLLAMYGANVGQLAWLGVEATVNQAICAMVTHPEETDSRFLYYALAGSRERLVGNAHGAAQQNLSQQLIKPFKLAVPALATQRRIGEILRSMDDLIENNRRRIEVLEEMARSIYREWFVKFRFPGHQDVPLVDSPMGKIPCGWRVGALSETAVVSRISVKPCDHPDTIFDHYSLPAFDEGQVPARQLGSEIRSNKYLIAQPSLLVSKLNPRIDRTWLAGYESVLTAIASTEFVVTTPTDAWSLEWPSLVVKSEAVRNRLVSMSGGTSTSHQRVKPQDFLNTPLVLPPPRLCTISWFKLFARCWLLDAACEARMSNLCKFATGYFPNL